MFWETIFKMPREKEKQVLFSFLLSEKALVENGWNFDGKPIKVYINPEKILIEKRWM